MRVLNTILLIDDDDTTNYLNERLLKRLQVAQNIKVVYNGEEGINYLKEHCHVSAATKDSVPELIFLDIKMPVMDGFEFLDEYHRLRPELVGDAIIIMLTSSTNQLDLNRLQQYQSIGKFLNKPLNEKHVIEIMAEFFPE